MRYSHSASMYSAFGTADGDRAHSEKVHAVLRESKRNGAHLRRHNDVESRPPAPVFNPALLASMSSTPAGSPNTPRTQTFYVSPEAGFIGTTRVALDSAAVRPPSLVDAGIRPSSARAPSGVSPASPSYSDASSPTHHPMHARSTMQSSESGASFMSSGYTDSDSGFSPSAPRGTPSDSLVAANPPSPPAGHGAFANVPGFVDVSAVTACDMGHDTRLSGGALAGTIALLPWSLAYHATKRTRVCRRCGINVTREKTLDPFR